MSGFADSTFALTPFGEGTPTSTTAPPSKPPEDAAWIDPILKEYALDDEGEIARMPEVRQQMLLAVITVLGSSSVDPTKGILLPKKIGDDLQRQARASVVAACKHVTDAKRARINDVNAEVLQTGRVRITISYDDLTLGTKGTLVV
jgi:hypothetical protein